MIPVGPRMKGKGGGMWKEKRSVRITVKFEGGDRKIITRKQEGIEKANGLCGLLHIPEK